MKFIFHSSLFWLTHKPAGSFPNLTVECLCAAKGKIILPMAHDSRKIGHLGKMGFRVWVQHGQQESSVPPSSRNNGRARCWGWSASWQGRDLPPGVPEVWQWQACAHPFFLASEGPLCMWCAKQGSWQEKEMACICFQDEPVPYV